MWAQWSFDKKLVAKALQHVGRLFPHYSRHDESHSIQILINVERLLGPDRVAQLSPTDAWLLLEAAYYHDLGMVVSEEEQRKDFDGDDFKNFLKQQVRMPKEDRLLADSLLLGNAWMSIVDGGHPLHAMELITQWLAEYYRRRHADRAATIALDPDASIGLSSPRNELIPKRLFRLLGEVCALHGRDREALMEMPYKAAGLGRDATHPRFVACLLRLGDLLDLEDNRFCPVMLRQVGDLPNTSHAHINKHQSIRHLRIDPERIEVQASCNSYDSYVETENWFEHLRRELEWQMAHWWDIVPNRDFGLMPTLGKIEAKLLNRELLTKGKAPRFELDQRNITELLQGAGLYSGPGDAIRELLQNAVDATMIRVWLIHGEGEGGGATQARDQDPSRSFRRCCQTL